MFGQQDNLAGVFRVVQHLAVDRLPRRVPKFGADAITHLGREADPSSDLRSPGLNPSRVLDLSVREPFELVERGLEFVRLNKPAPAPATRARK